MLHIDHLTLYLPVTNNYTCTKLILYNADGTGTHIEKKMIDMLTQTHAGCNKKIYIWHLNFQLLCV